MLLNQLQFLLHHLILNDLQDHAKILQCLHNQILLLTNFSSFQFKLKKAQMNLNYINRSFDYRNLLFQAYMDFLMIINFVNLYDPQNPICLISFYLK